jgi:hypothetical protein
MIYSSAKIAYNRHALRCKEGKVDKAGRPVEMRLTFEEWCDIWLESGRWAKRGNTRGSYCMMRNDDLGHYELGNVSIGLHSVNASEGRKGRTFSHTEAAKAKIGKASRERTVSDETKIRMSKAQSGKVHKAETKEKLSALWKGKAKTRGSCQYCSRELALQNMSRHENVCQSNPEWKPAVKSPHRCTTELHDYEGEKKSLRE